jgi:ribosomal protein S18 acetylase RimI-like enzyme
MAEHCLHEARRLGFHAMQFNYVISTNTAAIRLWQDLGFEIVARCRVLSVIPIEDTSMFT